MGWGNDRTLLNDRLTGLEHGQGVIITRVDGLADTVKGLAARDAELEGKLSLAVDRMTIEMVKQQELQTKERDKQQEAFHAAIKQTTEALREGLIETRLKRRLITISGRGMKWLERGVWAVLAAFGWKLWSTLAHSHGWDTAWWWPW